MCKGGRSSTGSNRHLRPKAPKTSTLMVGSAGRLMVDENPHSTNYGAVFGTLCCLTGIFCFNAATVRPRMNVRRKNVSMPSSSVASILGEGFQLRWTAALPASVQVFRSRSSSVLITPACWRAEILCTNGAVSTAPFRTNALSKAVRVPIVARTWRSALNAAYTSCSTFLNSLSGIFLSQSGSGRATGSGQCVRRGFRRCE